MNKIKNIKCFNYIIEVLSLFIFISLPLIFSPYLYGTWQISNYFLFQALVEIILFVWLMKIIIFNKLSINIKKNKIIFPAIIFISVLIIATVFSKSFQYSFWGDYMRKMGLITYFHFFLFYLILFFNIKNKQQIIRIFYAILFSTTITLFYGFLQIFGFDIFPWTESAFFNNRIFSTLGQPNFFASWLLLTGPVIIYFLLIFKKYLNMSIFKKYFYRPLLSCLFLFYIVILILTQSRGAWIGFFFGLFFFVLVFLLIKNKKKIFISLLSFFLIFIITIVLLNSFFSFTSNSDDTFLIKRLKSMTNLAQAGKLRLILWGNGFDLIKKSPIIGHGIETQQLLFFPYYEPELAALEAINMFPDRAHNDLIDTAIVSGLLGLLSYLFLLFSVFYIGIKYIIKTHFNESSLMILILLTGIFSYLISLQFSFHIIPTAVYFWAYLAIISKIILIKKNAII